MKLSETIQNLVLAFNNKDSVLLLSCFTQDAEVYDKGENQKVKGHKAIKLWFDGSFAKFDFTTEPFDYTESADRSVLKARVSGDFPGSPLNFLYEAHRNGDLINKLKISVLRSE